MDLKAIDTRLRLSFLALATIGGGALSAYAIWFWLHLERGLALEPDQWGQFGDFVGGCLNPLIAMYTLYWITVSVRLQKTELAETRAALVATQQAQERQAMASHLTAEISSVSTRLTAITYELAYYRKLLDRFVRILEDKGAMHLVYMDTGDELEVALAAQAVAKKIKELTTSASKFYEVLDHLSEAPANSA